MPFGKIGLICKICDRKFMMRQTFMKSEREFDKAEDAIEMYSKKFIELNE